MKKTIGLGIALSLTLFSVASAEPVSRRSADLYVSPDGRTAVATEGCTQTAHHMDSRVVEHRGRAYIVFYDEHGEEEADCRVVAVVRSVPRLERGVRIARR
jgi:hypothetical protein